MERTSGLISREQEEGMQGWCCRENGWGPHSGNITFGVPVQDPNSFHHAYCCCFPELLFSVLPTFLWGCKSPVCISTLCSFLSHFSSSLTSAGRDRNYSLLFFRFLLWFKKKDLNSTEEFKFCWDFLKKQTFSTWRSGIEAVACLRFICKNNNVALLFLPLVSSKGIWHTAQLQKGGSS